MTETADAGGGKRSAARTAPGAVAEDYLKAIWSATEWGNPPATVSSLTRRFATTKATVSTNLKRLAARGLVEHDPYRPILLTEPGDLLARRMVRRHRVLETFLVAQLGYGWDEIHDLAEELEHAATDDFVDRLHRMLGSPPSDPHGDPIPASDGTVRYPAGAIQLAKADPGDYRVTRVSDSVPGLLRELHRHGVGPGTPLSLERGAAATRIAHLAAADPIDVSDQALEILYVIPVR